MSKATGLWQRACGVQARAMMVNPVKGGRRDRDMAGRLSWQSAETWSRMAEGNLAAASQLAWQSASEVAEQRTLFEKVSGRRIDEADWRNKVTWGAAVLLALSVEQSLKVLAIRTSADEGCPKEHDLQLLWCDIPEECREGVRREVSAVRRRVAGTRLGHVALSGADETVRVHRHIFEKSRYYNETGGKRYGNLVHNVDLWQLALAANACARRIASP